MKAQRTTYYAFRSFMSYLGQYKTGLVLTVLGFVVSDVMLAVVPVLIGRLVSALAANPIHGHEAVIYTWLLIIMSTGHDIMWHVSELLYLKFLKPVGYRYENILFKMIIREPYPYFIDKFTGKMSSYVSSISQELRDFTDNICFSYTGASISLLAVLVILSSINWQTGLIFATGVLAMFAVGRHTIRYSNAYEKQSADTQSTKNAKIIDAIANFVNVKSFHKENLETASIAHQQDIALTAAKRSYLWNMVFWGSMGFFVRDFIWPATIGLNVYLFLHHQLGIGQLATLLSTILLFSSTIWELLWYISNFNLKMARVEEAHHYLFGPINIVERYRQLTERPTKTLKLQKHLELKDVSFAYPDKPDTSVLRHIDLKLEKGKKVGVVGRSGGGKTTLTKLLLSYYQLTDGSIQLDGEVVDTRDLAALISYVPQDTSLFHRTIAENIAYATDREVTHEEIAQAAKQAHADEFIRQIDKGYEALVGERGVKLSAGQRQRIAIARALLDDKPILILDEATSALDSESELLVQAGLENLWQEKTVIAIAHRLSTLRHMDHIIVVDKGQIVEEGTHQQLLKAKGTYATLWSHQSGGFILDGDEDAEEIPGSLLE